MKRLTLLLSWSVATVATLCSAPAAEWRWVPFPDPQLEVRGLPWFKENSPELWRLPKSAKGRVPNGVWNRAIAPDGGRIRVAATTTRLALRVQAATVPAKPCFIDAYVDDVLAGSVRVQTTASAELVFFEGRDRARKNLTIYLPNNQETRVLAVGFDPEAQLGPPPPFAQTAPLICYGSSVLQGTGSHHPGTTYPAAVARRLNLDFVNLGFGGAGKAEPVVVALVNQLEGCGYLFDLGKSYGDQSGDAYVAMLAAVRVAHPGRPIFCVTPIYSSFEPKDAKYLAKSIRLRDMMRQAANDRRRAGDAATHVIEGLELFGAGDQALLRDPQHPNDEGNELMARRLAPVLRPVILGPP
ncbi:MAG: hypothetical protein HZC55_23280 [Verrucomicrobia bacterium]|nr:hypothetical protein [Verrucomicrobiota bacterium]